MSVTVSRVKPVLELTVRNFYLCFALSKEGTTPTFDEKIWDLPVVKTIGVQPDSSTKKIFASGTVYDTTTNTRGGKINLGVVALPPEVVDKGLGAVGTGAQTYEVTLPKRPEFACGYVMENSDGSMVYYYHPRCQLNIADESHKTSDDGDLDPSVTYEIEILPTEEGVWKAKYKTALVAEGKVPFTPEEYFALLPYTKAEFDAINGSEKAASA